MNQTQRASDRKTKQQLTAGSLPVIALLTAVLFWGASFSTMRVAVNQLTPASVMWLRMVIACILLIPFAKQLLPDDYRKGDWKRLVPMVLFQPCLYFLFESNALQYTTSSQAGVISASVPLIVSLGAWLFLAEHISLRIMLGMVGAMAGVSWLTLSGDTSGQASQPLLGNSLELIAMICAAANLVMVKGLSRRYNPWTLTALQVVAGVVFFLPGSRHLFSAGLAVWNPSLVLVLLFLGSCVTLVAFGLYNWGMSRIPASRASAFINLVPVTAVAIGWGILGESLSLVQCMAGLMVIGGVMLSQAETR
ncbi:MAG: EamA family transporter [Deltaproteobacteria bacterium]|nr:MAG: EamA family transporter [Deltaproteobacteria bacterium]